MQLMLIALLPIRRTPTSEEEECTTGFSKLRSEGGANSASKDRLGAL